MANVGLFDCGADSKACVSGFCKYSLVDGGSIPFRLFRVVL